MKIVDIEPFRASRISLVHFLTDIEKEQWSEVAIDTLIDKEGKVSCERIAYRKS